VVVTTVARAGTTYSAPSLVMATSTNTDMVVERANNTSDFYWVGASGGWNAMAPAGGGGSTWSAPVFTVSSSMNSLEVVSEGVSNSLDYCSIINGTPA